MTHKPNLSEPETTEVPTRIFAVWIGGPIPDIRKVSLESMSSLGLPIQLIDENNLHEWILRDHPLHRSWQYLSAIHRGDYLRSYLMHYYGGGYSDIKPPRGTWTEAFRAFEDRNVWVLGYPEFRWGVANFGVSSQPRYQPFNPRWWKYRSLQLRYRSLIGNGLYAMRPGSELTALWLQRVEFRLDDLADELTRNPARVPKERGGKDYGGWVSRYPVAWSALHGDILQPLCWRFRKHVRQSLPAPGLENYQ